MDDENDEERRRPGRDLVAADIEGGVLTIGLDRFDAEQQEHPDARTNGCGVAAQDEALDESVQASGEKAEGSGEEEEGYNCAVFRFEAFE